MALTVTSLGRAQTTPPSFTINPSLGSLSPTAGSLLVVCLMGDIDGTTAEDGSCSVSDTFDATGKGTWTQGAMCRRVGTPSAGFREHVEVWTCLMGSAPGTGTVTFTYNVTGQPGAFGGWCWFEVFQVTGQHATPTGATTGTTGRQAAGPTTVTLTLSGSPAADSAVFSGIYATNTSTAATKPTGYTDGQIDTPAWGATSQDAYRNGGASSTVGWTGCATGSEYLAAALEIVAAAEAAADSGSIAPVGQVGPGSEGPQAWQWVQQIGVDDTGVTITGTVAATLDNVTAAITGTETITGTVAQTLAGVTAVITGAGTFTGTVAATLAGVTAAITGTETISGTVARTLAGVACSASGTVGTVAAVGLFPATVHASGRYIKDQNGDPWMMHGDAGWSLVSQLSLEDSAVYLDDRASRGVNIVYVNLIDAFFCDNAPNNFYNEAPFTGTALQSSLNEDYWQNVDAAIQHAGAHGITVMAFVAYLGFNHGADGWWAELAAASNAQVQAYGTALGNRYKDYDNIVWAVGGDYDPTATELDRYDHIMQGIQGTGDTHLATAHAQRTHDSATAYNSYSWLTLNAVYTGGSTCVADAVTAYNRATVRPTFAIEPHYEFRSGYTLANIRQEQWQVLLVGGLGGHFVGNEEVWSFGFDTGISTAGTYDWEAALDDSSTVHSALIKGLFDGVTAAAWTALVPDLTDTFLTAGESSGATQAAASFSTHVGLIYVATTGSITVDLTELSGTHASALCRWWDPTSGDYTSLGTISTASPHVFTHPGTNDAGDNDWVLVVEGTLDVTGTIARTLAGVTAAITGTSLVNVTGTVTRTLVGVTAAITGSETITGTIVQTLQGVTPTITATETITGTIVRTLAGVTPTITGTETFTGTAGATLAGVTPTITGTSQINITGTAAATLGGVTSAITGTVANPVTGTVAETLGGVTPSISGTVTAPFTGTVAATLQGVAASIAGIETISGTVSRTLAGVTAALGGTVVNPVTGTIASTLGPVLAYISQAPIVQIVAPPVTYRRAGTVTYHRAPAVTLRRRGVET